MKSGISSYISSSILKAIGFEKINNKITANTAATTNTDRRFLILFLNKLSNANVTLPNVLHNSTINFVHAEHMNAYS